MPTTNNVSTSLHHKTSDHGKKLICFSVPASATAQFIPLYPDTQTYIVSDYVRHSGIINCGGTGRNEEGILWIRGIGSVHRFM